MLMTYYDVLLYIFVGLYGLLIGSFLNVCIFRIPKGEGIALTRSHCMNCGYELKWYDLIPVFSYVGLKGRCRKCKEHISIQYPLIEGLNAVMYVIVFLANGFTATSVIYCLFVSALIVLSVIDFRTFEIPEATTRFIAILGVIQIALDYQNWSKYVIGFFVIVIPLDLLWHVSGGQAIGGGDVKLMGAAALLLGYKYIVLAFFVGCIVGSPIHLIRMKVSKEGKVLAMGPYLSIGIVLTMFFGESFFNWYLGGLLA